MLDTLHPNRYDIISQTNVFHFHIVIVMILYFTRFGQFFVGEQFFLLKGYQFLFEITCFFDRKTQFLAVKDVKSRGVKGETQVGTTRRRRLCYFSGLLCLFLPVYMQVKFFLHFL